MLTLGVRFNSKSSVQSVGDALALAEAHDHVYKGKMYVVTVSDISIKSQEQKINSSMMGRRGVR